MRVPQALDLSRTRNVDKSRANAPKNGVESLFAPKGIKNVHTLNVLTTINVDGGTMINYYV